MNEHSEGEVKNDNPLDELRPERPRREVMTNAQAARMWAVALSIGAVVSIIGYWLVRLYFHSKGVHP